MSEKYDVVIIGAGIGGLVCGCYLAKAGLKVLIVEKHYQVGGYCSSFKRKGFTFDASVHYIGGGRPAGEIGRLRREFNLDRFIKLKRIDPRDNIILPDVNLLIRKNISNTIEGIKKTFPSESKNIDSFFRTVRTKSFFSLYGKLKSLCFSDLLNEYFENYKLKSALSILLGNIGLPPGRASALTSVYLYREFIIDGGYYPKGGNQAFADGLKRLFESLGGEVLLSAEANQILIKNNNTVGVALKNGKYFRSKFVVSNIDATRTYKDLLDYKRRDILDRLKKLEVSPSAFVVYLGLNINLPKSLKYKCASWFFSSYDIEYCYGETEKNIALNKLNYVVCTFPSLYDSNLAPRDKSIMQLFILAPFKTMNFWEKHKENLAKKMIMKAENVIPNLNKYIEVKVIATPHTFYRYTANHNGAIYGWASTPAQINKFLMPNETNISGLYLAGHWATSGLGQGGITTVAYSGRHTAEKIIEKIKN